ncbi:uncharacterized protein [Littorina saxatilis]|uniref:uncharacterized protein n=1 Tax=Littorina saxatilis TaxID=31220 RepID=UPI0038B4D7FE
MVFPRHVALCVLLYFVSGAESVKLWDCGSFVEDVESPIVYCYADLLPSIVNWTLFNEAGVTRYLGACNGYDSCSSDYNSSTLTLNSLNHPPNYNILFPQIHREFSGTLMCQGTLANGTVISDTCELKLVRVKITSVDVLDGDSGYVECTNYPYALSTVTWTLTTDSGQPLDLGTCTDVNNCSSPHSPNIDLTRPSNDSSRVDFERVNRTLQGQLSCSIAFAQLRYTDTRTLNVYHPATVNNCGVDISRHNWSAILSCDITDVFSSAGVYNFHMTQIVLDGFTLKDEDVFDGRRSYRDGLTSYVSNTDNQVYYRGTLTYSWHLLPVTRLTTGFLVYVHDGHSVSGFTSINKFITIAEPGLPTHNCGDQMYFPETGVVPCVCTIDSLGSPEGRLVWLLDNIAIATGDYGVTQLKFPSGNVSRERDGMMATCQVDWVQAMAAVNTSHVTSSENIKLAINMTLKYLLQTVCTRANETEVETQVLARIVQQNQEWPGLCADSACTNAHVNATCDGEVTRSITTVVVIEQVPHIVRSNKTQSTGSTPRDVLLSAAVQEDAFDLQSIGATLNKTEILVSVLKTCTTGYIDPETNCVKREEPSPTSPVPVGPIIGGVVAFLVVVIIILVIVVYRKCLKKNASIGLLLPDATDKKTNTTTAP